MNAHNAWNQARTNLSRANDELIQAQRMTRGGAKNGAELMAARGDLEFAQPQVDQAKAALDKAAKTKAAAEQVQAELSQRLWELRAQCEASEDVAAAESLAAEIWSLQAAPTR